jgi:hypothetical protein
MITTSYFARAGHEPAAVSIALSRPRWLPAIPSYLPLAPPRQLITEIKSGKIGPAAYTTRYRAEILDRRDAGTVAGDLRDLAGPDAILCCWEKPGRFCHRHLVAAWLREHGYDVEERA